MILIKQITAIFNWKFLIDSLSLSLSSKTHLFRSRRSTKLLEPSISSPFIGHPYRRIHNACPTIRISTQSILKLSRFVSNFATNCNEFPPYNSRSLIFTFPYNVIGSFRNLCLALLLSLLLGTIFWHVRAAGREQEIIWDRIMFYHCLLAIVPVPLYLIQMNDGKFRMNPLKIGSLEKIFTKKFLSKLGPLLAFVRYLRTTP